MISQQLAQNTQKNSITILKNHEAIYFEEETRINLHNSFHIYSKAIGIDQSSKNMADFMAAPYLIDKYACYYLIEHKFCTITNKDQTQILPEIYHNIKTSFIYKVYKDLINSKKMYLISGHKFGGQFLAYQANPDLNHAKYLVFIKHRTIQISQQKNEGQHKNRYQKQLNHMSRLAGLCKKIGLLAINSIKDEEQGIQYRQIQQQNKFKKQKKQRIRSQKKIKKK